MTASSFGWLAHDDGERRRMMEVIDLFREKGTRRRARASDHPRHVRRAVLPGHQHDPVACPLLPLHSVDLPAARGASASRSPRAGRRARRLQAKLVESLKAGGEGTTAGLIGIDAGASPAATAEHRSTGPACAAGDPAYSRGRPTDTTRRSTRFYREGGRLGLRRGGAHRTGAAQLEPRLPPRPDDLLDGDDLRR